MWTHWQAPEYKNASSLSDEELLKTQQRKKGELLDWVWRHYGLWHTWKEQVQGKTVVLWTRRITGYKRMDLLNTICKDVSLKRVFVNLLRVEYRSPDRRADPSSGMMIRPRP